MKDITIDASNTCFTPTDTAVGSLLYWYLVPVFQFATAVMFADTWQYFYHRTVHVNKWLYSKFQHIS